MWLLMWDLVFTFALLPVETRVVGKGCMKSLSRGADQKSDNDRRDCGAGSPATTLVTPPLLAYVARADVRAYDTSERPGDGGIDDLVAGTAEMRATRPSASRERSADTST